jgi:gas vesicle protein
MSDNNDFGSFFAGFVIGGLVGAAMALMLAPQSGEETRRVIQDRSIELRDKAVETSQEAIARAEKTMEETRIKTNQSLEELRGRIDELSQVAREKTTELQQRLPKTQADEAVEEAPASDEAAA